MTGLLTDATFPEVLLRVVVVLIGFAGVVLVCCLIMDALERAAEQQDRLDEWRGQ